MKKEIFDPHYKSKEWRETKEKELTAHQIANPDTLLTITFLKDAAGWYADVPHHTRGQNALVAGAGSFVESLARGEDRVTVRFRTVEPPKGVPSALGKPLFKLRRAIHDPWGATYFVTGKGIAFALPVWICNVTETLLGDHPKRIFVYSVLPGE